jgi:hypothetical protein
VEFPGENVSLLNNERDLSESENWKIPGEAGERLTGGDRCSSKKVPRRLAVSGALADWQSVLRERDLIPSGVFTVDWTSSSVRVFRDESVPNLKRTWTSILRVLQTRGTLILAYLQ